jgi:hypothetical protein
MARRCGLAETAVGHRGRRPIAGGTTDKDGDVSATLRCRLPILAIPLRRGPGYAPGIMAVITPDRAEQRLVWTLVAVLTVVLAYALAGATGAAATSVLHWTGVGLLVAGICLAVAGMSGTRDERMRREEQFRRARERSVGLDILVPQEAGDQEVAIVVDLEPQQPVVGGMRANIAALAGGEMRLQWWGVACLVVGTILTAVW